jgi:predicted ferric reductase
VHRWVVRTIWAALYLIVMAVPAALSWAVPGEDVVDRLAVESGLLAVSALVCAAVLPARLRSLTRSIGIEDVNASHRWLGCFTAAMVAFHLAVVLAQDPANISRLDLVHGSTAGRAGTLAALALLVLVAWALRPRRNYERWMVAHVALATAVVGFTGLHVWALRSMVDHPVVRIWFAVLVATLVLVELRRWAWRRYVPSGAYRVCDVRDEAPGVFTLDVAPWQRRHRPIRFAPGQFAWLRLRPSLLAEQHPFTIASSATRPTRLRFTIREAGDFTIRLAKLQPGDPVWLDGPHGAFTLDELPTTGLVMIAGGVGITPMMSMLRTLADRGDRRPHRLIAVARTSVDLLFSAELAELRGRLNLEVIGLVRRPDDDATPGDVDEELLVRTLPGPFRREQLSYLVSGSTEMVTTVLCVLNALDIPRRQIYTERFDGA